MPRSLPEITLLVVDENKQCNHPQHYLYRITSLLVFRSNILQMTMPGFTLHFCFDIYCFSSHLNTWNAILRTSLSVAFRLPRCGISNT